MFEIRLGVKNLMYFFIQKQLKKYLYYFPKYKNLVQYVGPFSELKEIN